MREIKFRAWDKKLKEMFNQGALIEPQTGDLILELKNENLELMQYTGLKDKNGKEIYEGDVVKASWLGEVPALAVVEWKDDGWAIRYKENSLTDNLMDREILTKEVIGNIYENPELIK